MKQYQRIALILPVVLVCASSAFGAGFGGYFTTHYGHYRWEVGQSVTLTDSTFGGIDRPSPGRPVILGGGVVWDTCLGKDQVFNFRQNIGYDSHLNSTVRLTQVGLVNTFGFAPVRKGMLRFWLGPQVNLHYRWGKDAKKYYTPSVYAIAYPGAVIGIRRKYEYVTIGTGLALGLNINVHRHVTLAFDLGMQVATSLWGRGRDMDRITASCWGYEGFLNIAVLGRFNE